MLSSSRWIMNGGPSKCFGCGNPFPHRENRIEAQVGADGNLYCYGTTCEPDALEARARAELAAATEFALDDHQRTRLFVDEVPV
jgi:hypothetical protein